MAKDLEKEIADLKKQVEELSNVKIPSGDTGAMAVFFEKMLDRLTDLAPVKHKPKPSTWVALDKGNYIVSQLKTVGRKKVPYIFHCKEDVAGVYKRKAELGNDNISVYTEKAFQEMADDAAKEADKAQKKRQEDIDQRRKEQLAKQAK